MRVRTFAAGTADSTEVGIAPLLIPLPIIRKSAADRGLGHRAIQSLIHCAGGEQT